MIASKPKLATHGFPGLVATIAVGKPCAWLGFKLQSTFPISQ